MTRTVVTAATILLLALCVGCQNPDQGRGQKLPQRGTPYTDPSAPVPVEAAASSDEIDLVEGMVTHRQAYRRGLEALIQHYSASGSNQKATWAREELEALDRIPQYRYIIEAQVLPADLKAKEKIQAADDMYGEAVRMEQKAGVLPVLKNEDILRAALNKYGELIRLYPTSDKIDDAAFRMGGIHEYFNDHTIALSFYQRAYQWDPDTPYPARFKAAYLLDNKLRRRAEALELYQEAVIREQGEWKPYAEQRIRDLSRSDSGGS